MVTLMHCLPFFVTEIQTLRNTPRNEYLYYGFSFYSTLPNAEIQEINWWHVQGISFIGGCIIFSFFIMTFFAIKGYMAIKKWSNMSTNNSFLSKTLQSQLFYSLIIQTAIPIVLIYFPSVLILIGSFFGATEEIYGHVFTVSVSLFPVIDPLPSIIIIHPYQKAIRTCCRHMSKMQSMSVTIVDPRATITSRAVTF
uniref:Seven TM Receptor n=1 Tax=Caenorhabditis tropicalis TaxID=1561998 RepID=A0A1I7T6K1_9PELO